MSSKKGVKLSLGEFIGPPSTVNALPTGPADRGPDDDGSFQRHRPRRDDESAYEPSRSDGDNNWRRGGGGGGGFGGGAGSSSSAGPPRSGGYNDREREGYSDRDRGGFNNDRNNDRDRGGFNNDRDRGGFNNDRNNDRDRGGYNNDRNNDRGSYNNDRNNDRGGYNNDRGEDRSAEGKWRGSSTSTSVGARAGSDIHDSAPSGERPRLQLKSRTAPMPTPTNNTTSPVISKVQEPEEKQPKDETEKEAETHLSTDVAVAEIVPASSGGDAEKPQETASANKADGGGSPGRNKEDQKKREPEVVNSRAAAFGAAPDHKREVSSKQDDNCRCRVRHRKWTTHTTPQFLRLSLIIAGSGTTTTVIVDHHPCAMRALKKWLKRNAKRIRHDVTIVDPLRW